MLHNLASGILLPPEHTEATHYYCFGLSSLEFRSPVCKRDAGSYPSKKLVSWFEETNQELHGDTQ